jgi:hypothetical protein
MSAECGPSQELPSTERLRALAEALDGLQAALARRSGPIARPPSQISPQGAVRVRRPVGGLSESELRALAARIERLLWA